MSLIVFALAGVALASCTVEGLPGSVGQRSDGGNSGEPASPHKLVRAARPAAARP
jgi:hypothetical protein